MAENYCIFSPVYLPNVEGVGKYTYNLARNLRALGKNVFIVSDNLFGAPSFEVDDGIKIYRLPCLKLFGGKYTLPEHNPETKGIIGILTKIKFTAVIVNDTFYPVSRLGIRIGKESGSRVIAVEHGESSVFGVKHEKLLRFFMNLSMKRAKKRVDCVYASSKEAYENLVSSGVECSDILYGRSEEKTGRKSGKKPLSVLVVGDYDAAASAVSGVSGGYTVSYVGAGEVAGAENYPNVSYTKFSEMAASADILYASSEGLPYTVSLAAANGTFIITGKNSDTEYFTNGGETGILVEDTKDIVPAILKSCDDEYRKSVTKKMQDRFLKKFSSAYAADKIIEFAEKGKEDQNEKVF